MFTPQELQNLLAQRPIFQEPPWGTGNERRILRFYRRVVEDAQRSLELRSKFEWNHYGSGYASYVDAWFYRPDPEFRVETGRDETEGYCGLVVLLSRLSPFFVFLEGEKHWSPDGAGSYLPSRDAVDALTTPAVEGLAPEMEALLQGRGLRRLSYADLAEPLSSDIDVPTILTDPPYTEFDALFHWEE